MRMLHLFAGLGAAALLTGITVTVPAQAATAIDLGTLGGTSSGASAINALGQVAGDSVTAAGYREPFRWTPSGGMQDLGTLGGHGRDHAAAINALG